MNSTFSFSRLTAVLPKVGLPKTIVRHGSKKPKPDPKSIKPKTPPPPFDPSYAERLYLFQHTRAGHVIYSHTKVIKANKALRQIPFNGKKLRPTTIRKDYWRPMAVLEFPKGQGEVGRSVLQKLREFRKRHELEWEDPELRKMDKVRRGKALNDQRANTVADLSVVLGGAGKGNKIWLSPEIEKKQKEREARKLETEKEIAAGLIQPPKKQQEKKPLDHPDRKEPRKYPSRWRHEATIYWADEIDAAWADTWPDNVKHVLGFPSDKDGVPLEEQEVVLEEADEVMKTLEGESKPEAKEQQPTA